MPGYCILVSDFKLKNTVHSDSKLVLPLPKYRNASALCGTAAAADLDFCARWPVRSLPGRPPRPSVPVPKSRSGGGGPPPPPSVSESRGLCQAAGPNQTLRPGPALPVVWSVVRHTKNSQSASHVPRRACSRRATVPAVTYFALQPEQLSDMYIQVSGSCQEKITN